MRRSRRNHRIEAGLIALGLTAIVLMYMVIAIGIYTSAQGAGVITADTPTPRQTLPQKCAEFSKEPDPATWDDELDTYPLNHEWMDCMGVGLK